MSTYTAKRLTGRLARQLGEWQRAALGLLVLSVAVNTGLCAALDRERSMGADIRAELQQAEHIRDQAVAELGAVSLDAAKEAQARQEQAEAYEAIGAYEYVGVCTVTAYCPCEACCGEWAHGITATGLPAVPGIVAVDPEVIPLGSTVILDGQKYLAADTGVKGNHVDIYIPHHELANNYGKHWESVWIEAHHD